MFSKDVLFPKDVLSDADKAVKDAAEEGVKKDVRLYNALTEYFTGVSNKRARTAGETEREDARKLRDMDVDMQRDIFSQQVQVIATRMTETLERSMLGASSDVTSVSESSRADNNYLTAKPLTPAEEQAHRDTGFNLRNSSLAVYNPENADAEKDEARDNLLATAL